MWDFIRIYDDSLLVDDGWWCHFTILKKYELVSLGRMTSHIWKKMFETTNQLSMKHQHSRIS